MMIAMKIFYSASEAKARFSEILRAVSDGQTVTVTYRGEPVAEIRPIDGRLGKVKPSKRQTVEERLDELRRRGILKPAYGPIEELKPGPHIPGALDRFLKERG